MNAAKGYYSLIQYCPDLSRLEAANVGVLLFRPEPHFIAARTACSVQRIRRFFGSEDRDWEQIKAMISAVEERLTVEGDHFRTLQDLERFIATRGNAVQLTPPRPMKVVHPVQELEALFQRLVGGAGARRKEAQSVARRLEESLTEQGVAPLVRRDVTVEVRPFHRPITVPFGFQNGRFNLIQTAAFRQERLSGVINLACRHAVEGRSLYERPDERLGALQLWVVGDFPPGRQEAEEVARDILHDNQVRLFTVAELPELVEEIRATGKPVTERVDDPQERREKGHSPF
jgi:Protein of unknown function (DUF3037)